MSRCAPKLPNRTRRLKVFRPGELGQCANPIQPRVHRPDFHTAWKHLAIYLKKHHTYSKEPSLRTGCERLPP